MGAKNHAIVMPDADREDTINALVGACYGSTGQRCMAISVAVPVTDKVADALVEKLVPKIEALKIGPSVDPSAEMGPLITSEHLNKVTGYIDEGVNEGAKLVVDGRNTKPSMQGYENGYFIGGSLFDNVTKDMSIYKNEIFGPIMTVNSFNSECEVIKLANMSGYGLSASIFGKNKQKMKFIADRLKVGSICFNDVLTHYGMADLPFGGAGLSGIGKVHGKEGLRAFSMQKSYLSNKVSLKSEFWWFEKRENFGKLIKSHCKQIISRKYTCFISPNSANSLPRPSCFCSINYIIVKKCCSM